MSDPTNAPPKKLRNAELISPPNVLKDKAGTGGINESTLTKAQSLLQSNTVDFCPLGSALIDAMGEATQNARNGVTRGEAAIESIIYPVMQLKAQGSMFNYPLITEISNVLVDFLETVTEIDADVFEIILAHKRALNAVILGKMQGNGGKTGKDLHDALVDACNRFYRTHQKP